MTPKIVRTACGLICAALMFAPALCSAQDAPEETRDTRLYSLLNIQTPELPDVRRGVYNFDIRAIGGDEDQTYFGIGGVYTLRNNFAIIGRVTYADKRFRATAGTPVPSGGTEWEVAGKWRFLQRGASTAAVQIGLLYPNNTRGSDLEFAGQLQYSRQLGEKTTVYFVPKLLLGRRSIFTLGGGVSYRVNSDFSLFGDIQGPIGTDNTYSTNTGARTGREIWGVGFRYHPEAFGNRASVDFGVTNGLGSTTGYSMTPGLADSAAFFVNFLYRL